MIGKSAILKIKLKLGITKFPGEFKRENRIPENRTLGDMTETV